MSKTPAQLDAEIKQTLAGEPKRDTKSGRYAESNNWERMCVCGHTLGVHAAAVVGGQRPCFSGDMTGIDCSCRKFKKSKA